MKKINDTKVEVNDIELSEFLFPNGRQFPYSYMEFARNYGYGISAGMFLVYVPLYNHSDSFCVRSKEIISTYNNVLEDENELWFDLKPDLEYARLKDLSPFAMSENGHYLFWDVESKLIENEFDIYITDFKGLGFTKVAGNLWEFFEKITSEEYYKDVLPFSNCVLPKTFKSLE